MDNADIKYFTNKELKAFFKAIEKDNSKYRVRNECIFKLAYYCALRVSEVALIQVDDFNNSRNEIYCRRLKGSLNNTIRIVDPDILRSVKRYLRTINHDTMFISQKGLPISRKTLDKLMKKYCEIAKIKDKDKWHFHTLKHTRAVDLAEIGLDLKEIQYWLGHKEISNTQIYFQFTSSQYETLYKKLKKDKF
ncbi:MAG: tyrosine-type recombinase/integrase [Clostridium celatum]|nr:tyrosine-type recombinase/integrase [Clostridium celatum]